MKPEGRTPCATAWQIVMVYSTVAPATIRSRGRRRGNTSPFGGGRRAKRAGWGLTAAVPPDPHPTALASPREAKAVDLSQRGRYSECIARSINSRICEGFAVAEWHGSLSLQPGGVRRRHGGGRKHRPRAGSSAGLACDPLLRPARSAEMVYRLDDRARDKRLPLRLFHRQLLVT